MSVFIRNLIKFINVWLLWPCFPPSSHALLPLINIFSVVGWVYCFISDEQIPVVFPWHKSVLSYFKAGEVKDIFATSAAEIVLSEGTSRFQALALHPKDISMLTMTISRSTETALALSSVRGVAPHIFLIVMYHHQQHKLCSPTIFYQHLTEDLKTSF